MFGIPFLGQPSVVPVSGQVENGDRRIDFREPVAQQTRIAAVVDLQIDLVGDPHKGEFLSLVVQFALAARRTGHKGDCQPVIVQIRRGNRRSQPPHRRIVQECVLGDKALLVGQDLPRRP